MIRKLEVKGLNTRVDGAWEFNEDLNIITGRNGSGKTTLLKLIWYLISGNLEQIISDIPFQSVSIETDAFSLFFIQFEPGKAKLECKFADTVKANKIKMNADFPLRIEENNHIDAIKQQTARERSSLFFPSFRRIEGGFARNSGFTYTGDSTRNHRPKLRLAPADQAADMLQEAISELSTEVSVYNHKFIASISTDDIVELLTEKYADVSSNTNELHVKLSEEITQKISGRQPSEDEKPLLESIQKRVEQVTKERDFLLKPFSVLEERIGNILQYKGIRVTEKISFGQAKEAIESDKLSAGEKQMLSFLYYNTFSENAAIFIDEPELSLHVDWQRLLLPALLEQATGNQFFIATHSPFIYAKYPDKEILLGEDRGGD